MLWRTDKRQNWRCLVRLRYWDTAVHCPATLEFQLNIGKLCQKLKNVSYSSCNQHCANIINEYIFFSNFNKIKDAKGGSWVPLSYQGNRSIRQLCSQSNRLIEGSIFCQDCSLAFTSLFMKAGFFIHFWSWCWDMWKMISLLSTPLTVMAAHHFI